MTTPTIYVNVRRTKSRHEGGTKHYAMIMMTFRIPNTTRSHSVIIRVHGAIGKASRVTVEHFGNLSEANEDYEKLIKEKHKRGYLDMFKNDEMSIQEVLKCEESAARLFLNPSLKTLMSHTALTANTKVETLSALLPQSEQEDLADAVEGIMGCASDYQVAPQPKKGFIDKIEEANNAILQLEQKRRESYGNQWGSW